jgi:dipeptidyl aminopeptidase/acylaminoacyl peptidase
MSNKDGSYDWNLYKYDFKTKTTSLIYKNVSYAFRMRKFGNGFTFFAIQGASSFPVFYNADTEKVEKFSGITADDSVSIINSKVMSFSGGVHGVLLTPQNFDSNTPHQLVVWLHGGPYRQTSQGFHPYASYAVYDLILNDLVKNNVVVLKLDYRGSYGYGGVFAKAIKGSVGNGDVSDVMTALSSVKKTMTISDSYLMGNSYGGYLALRGVVAYPKQFAGAISINGVTDWPTLVDQLQNSIFNSFFGGLPNKNNAKLYSKASIISRIPNLTDQKIVIIQAQADKTIPPSQADLLFNDLKGQGKNATFYPYAGEDHTFTKVNDIEGICKNVFTTLSLPLGNSCNFE